MQMMTQTNSDESNRNPAPIEPASSRVEQAGLWPSENYAQQIEQLKNAVGKQVFLVELGPSDIRMSISLTDRAYELIAVLDFPRPDPEKRNFPHMIVLDDGRGINLGRIARISINTAFDPPPEHILYLEPETVHHLIYRKRRLSRASIINRSRALLGMVLGRVKKPTQRLE